LEAHLAKLQGRGDDVLRLVLDPAATTGLRQLPSTFTSVELLIGPEGGLSEREIDLARRVGYCSLRLGPRVLRTETAAAAAIAVLQALYGDLG
jgi:16S rRNA (uracil1498-N3)-methyltransferase